MSSDDQERPPGADQGPATSWVRMPDREARSPRLAEPAPTWTPPTARGPAEPPVAAPPTRAPDAPFGGFEPPTHTAMMRRGADRGRFWGVLGLVLLVLGLGAAAVVLSLRERPPKPQPEIVRTPPPKPPEPPVDDPVDAELDALNYTKSDPKAPSTTSAAAGGKQTKTHKKSRESTRNRTQR